MPPMHTANPWIYDLARFATPWAAPLLTAAALAWAAARRPWRLLRRDALQHAWLGTLVLMALCWTARATLADGLAIQLIGATLAVTLFGLPLALLSLFIVDGVSLLGLAYFGGQGWTQIDWPQLWPRYAALGLLPAAVSAAMHGAMRQWLPRHPFIFILGHGYFTAGVAAMAAGAAQALGRFLLHPPHAVPHLADELTGLLIIAFGEAFLTGMLVAVFVVYRPQWVVTFRHEEYLRG